MTKPALLLTSDKNYYVNFALQTRSNVLTGLDLRDCIDVGVVYQGSTVSGRVSGMVVCRGFGAIARLSLDFPRETYTFCHHRCLAGWAGTIFREKRTTFHAG